MFRSFCPLSLLVAVAAPVTLMIAFGSTPAFAQDVAASPPPSSETQKSEQGKTKQGKTEQTGGDADPLMDDLLGPAPPALSKDPGQKDLDEAAVLRFDAKDSRQLLAVERLLQSAIEKGLTGENESFAKKMLGSVLLQKSQQIVAAIGQVPQNRALALRDEAVRSLEQALSNDPELVEAYLLVARLNMLPGGDKAAVAEATSKAIEILDDNPVERSAALTLRALTWELGDEDKRLADLNSAIKDDPNNIEALRLRAALRLQEEDITGAVEDLGRVMEQDPTNQQVAQTVVGKLAELDRVDDALALLTKALEKKPSEGLYRMRAVLHRINQKDEEALADLNKALAMQPKDPMSLLQRAEIAITRNNVQSAKRDLRAAERIAPGVAGIDQAIFVRCLIAIEEGRMADAINEMKTLVDRDPGNDDRMLQLGTLYYQDKRPRKAIEIFSSVLDRNPKSVIVLERRANTYLDVGDHDKAILDYESALQAAGDQEGYDLSALMNNLAWLLATSPNDEIRNGKRSVELGEKAVELTDSKEPHILSTLAAGYAELGDFKKAIEWSSKAVEVGQTSNDGKPHEQLDQLKEELESYRKNQPWREKQETKENAVPILSPDDLIDT